MTFSFSDRATLTKKLKTTTFDMLIIGGGITGAGIALDAASRGMKVALVEQNDFASGTSSKSTKLIHGGLRYLKQFDFWLVKEVGTERAIIHKLAPHLVVPEKMVLPLIANGTYGEWLTSIGLKVYDVLAQVSGDDKRKMLNKKQALKIEPLLPKSILKGAAHYAEYRTDDARLTIEVLKTAIQKKATAINYTSATAFLYTKDRVSGAKVKDNITGNEFNINAKYVVNAAGPWVDDLRQLNNSKTGKRLHLTKGVHLVVSKDKLPVKQSVYFDIPDGRMMFAIPRGKVTYFGTTDTNYQADKNNVDVSIADASYLIAAVNNIFPEVDITLADIQSSWAGLRPLIHEEGKSASELSRKDELFVSDTALISIAGGKLTGYRKMAERIVDLVAKKYKRRYQKTFKAIQTEKIVISGGEFKNNAAVKKYIQKHYKALATDGFSEIDVQYLVHNYGTQTAVILDNYKSRNGDDAHENMILAELWYGVNYEMICTPTDFFMRRTGRLFFDMPSVLKYKVLIINEMKTAFNWSDEENEQYTQSLNRNIEKVTSFE